jgi:hypothetical protein
MPIMRQIQAVVHLGSRRSSDSHYGIVIGVGRVALHSPSLRSGQAVLPPTALRLAVSAVDDFMDLRPAARVPVCQRKHWASVDGSSLVVSFPIRLVDWLMRLPEGLEREYKEELTQFERSRAMPYTTSIERMGRFIW